MKTPPFKSVLFLLALALWALTPASPAATTNLVRMGNYDFNPTNLTINAGDTVRWTNTAATAHDTTANSGLWSSPTFGSPNTYSFRFTNSGNYPYYCALHVVSHPEQTGTVSVAASVIPPTVSITSPASRTDFSTPATFTFSATAADSDGSVTNVKFYAGATLLGLDASSPFSITASNLTTGTYSLTAVATDNSGLNTTSSPVTILVGTTRYVKMGDYYFNPTNITINPMDTVVWTNIAATAHDTTANSGLWSSPTFGSPNTYSFRFTNSGNYPYYCAVHVVSHPEQTGTVSVAASVIPPTVSITSPASGTDFSTPATFTFSATAADSDGSVTNMKFYAGATLLGSDASSPFSITASNLTTGTYSLTAVATDNSGLNTTSSPVTILVGTTRYVKMGDYYFNPTNITINPMDTVVWTNIAATAHDTTANSGLWSSPTFGSPNTYSFRFTNSGNYPYYCAVHVVSHPEQTGTVSVASSGNIVPSVAITNPANGAVFTAPASFTLAASASDSDGSVTQVQFFQATSSLGVDTTSPYSVAVSSLAAGSYIFSAVVTDNLGAKVTNTISLTVNALPTASITSPTNNASFFGPTNITINASANDSDGTIAKVEFFQGTNKLGEDLTSPYSLTWSNVAAGTYTLTAKATDNLGAVTTSAAVSISVSNSSANPVTILNPFFASTDFIFSFTSQSGRTYSVEYRNALDGSGWLSQTNLTGNGAILKITNRNPSSATRFYRVGGQ